MNTGIESDCALLIVLCNWLDLKLPAIIGWGLKPVTPEPGVDYRYLSAQTIFISWLSL